MRMPLSGCNLLLGFVFVAPFIFSCKAPQAPTLLRLQSPRLLAAADSTVVVMVEAVVENPNSYNIQVHRGNLTCAINDQPAGEAILDSTVTLPAKAQATVPVKLRLRKEKLLQNGLQLLLGKALNYTLSGKIIASRGGMRIGVPVQEKGSLDQSLLRDLLR